MPCPLNYISFSVTSIHGSRMVMEIGLHAWKMLTTGSSWLVTSANLLLWIVSEHFDVDVNLAGLLGSLVIMHTNFLAVGNTQYLAVISTIAQMKDLKAYSLLPSPALKYHLYQLRLNLTSLLGDSCWHSSPLLIDFFFLVCRENNLGFLQRHMK